MSEKLTLFDRFGGTRKMADHLGEPPSTVQSWKTAGRIPAFKQPDVLAKGQELGLAISADDIIFPLGRDGSREDDFASATKSGQFIGNADALADNSAANIRDHRQAPESEGEADSLHPFLEGVASTPPSSPTCSPMSAPQQQHPESRACSDGEAKAA